MSIILNTGFSIGSKDLIYDKFVLTKEEMLNIHENTYPDHFFALCSDDDKMYSFNINRTPNAETGKFRELTSEEISTADAVTYKNDTIGSTNVEEALNTVIADLHTHDNKKVIDLLSESNEGKLQYNGITIGGASAADAVTYENDTIGSTNVEEALNKLISDYYYVKPSINSFKATPAGGVFEVGTTITAPIAFNWSYNKDIKTQILTDCTLTDNTDRMATYDSDITSNKTFTLNASDGKNNVSKSVSYTFVNPYYVGVSSTDTLTETDIKALTKKVEAKGNKTINYTTSQSYMVFAYPSSYGAISSIIDQNGFNVTDSFVRNTVTVNSVEYYVYVSNQCSGTYTMKFNY